MRVISLAPRALRRGLGLLLPAWLAWAIPEARAQAPSLSVATVEVPAGTVASVAVTLSSGTDVSAAQLTVSSSPAGALSFVGVEGGALLTPAGSFTLTTNPGTISEAQPAAGPISILVDSTGTSMATGAGSLVVLRVRAATPCAAATLTLSGARLTKALATVIPATTAGGTTCPTDPGLTLAAGTAAAASGATVSIPVTLSSGAGVSAAMLTVSPAPAGAVSIVGVEGGALLSPAGDFTLTTNPATVSEAQPATGPVSILVDSTGTSMAAGSGSLVVLRVRAATPCAVATLSLSGARVTRNLATAIPATTAGGITCASAQVPQLSVAEACGAAAAVVDVPVQLSAGADVSAAQFTITAAAAGNVEVVGVQPGTLLQPEASFTITTSQATLSEAQPADLPLTVLVDSTGTSMGSGAGSVVILRMRSKTGCTGRTELGLSAARVTLALASVVPTTVAGGFTCTCCVAGDIHPEAGNGSASLADFVMAARKARGSSPVTARDRSCADLHPGSVTCRRAAGPLTWCAQGDGDVDADDAAIVRGLAAGTLSSGCDPCTPPATTPGERRLPGDVAPRGGGNDALSPEDVDLVRSFVLARVAPTAEERLRCDVAPASRPGGVLTAGGNGSISIADVVLVARARSGPETVAWPLRLLGARMVDAASASAFSVRTGGWPAWAQPVDAVGGSCAADGIEGLDVAGSTWAVTCEAEAAPVAGPALLASFRYRAPEAVDPSSLTVASSFVDAALASVTRTVTLQAP